MQRFQVVLRVEPNIPATDENVVKLRSMLRTINEWFAERGMTRRCRSSKVDPPRESAA